MVDKGGYDLYNRLDKIDPKISPIFPKTDGMDAKYFIFRAL
jgi:hypothetical protein